MPDTTGRNHNHGFRHVPPRDEPLHFMGFPLEIRAKVYANLLCSFGEPEEKPEAKKNDDDVTKIDQVGRLAHTAILLANRQIYHEAKDVMLRQNQFVCIFMINIHVRKFPGRLIVHNTKFAAQDLIVRKFRGAVMSYYITGERPSWYCGIDPYNLIILARDLDRFLRVLVGPENDLPSLCTDSEHLIILEDPFGISTDAKYDLVKNQKSLLQPFQNHLRGFIDVKIQGNVDKELAKTVQQEIANEELPNPDVFLEEVMHLKDKGNEFFREGNLDDALRMCIWGNFMLRRLRRHQLWWHFRRKFGVDFLNSLAQLHFTLHSNIGQYRLQGMHEIQGADRGAKLLAVSGRVKRSAQRAMAGRKFSMTWQPSAPEKATVIFRSAQAARFAGELAPAQELIRRALYLQPNDLSIRREAREISDRKVIRELRALIQESDLIHK